MQRLIALYNLFLDLANRLAPIALLAARLLLAKIFFAAGLVKIADFSTTVALFADEYQVPVLPPLLAALSATAFELFCPVLLVLGLATRLATLPLLAMTLVIQLTYDQNIQHLFWLLLLGVLLSHGAGRLSVDAWLAGRFRNPAGVGLAS